ncbi:TetR/AcrR family transcriptional regulator [Amycolatopsis acidicola]|uniref:TetR/AcrR family transcriptional regulator n=1 Tax=Amycolatopsis acidicola TaxID=2596893 RepID=A0A5N0VDV9_9PSEU|nr:TetR/AcrR family transcriptional regulator [Amycolatopsis acidicola]KAA9163634.1 TetR/AcrR family transcriptional regulator [Amycolatopsis acidicola]
MNPSATVRTGYHHGDLRNALIRAAADLAREGGPRSVTIRAAARMVGVTPTAAYRHFAGHEELLQATRELAMTGLTEAMNAEVKKLPGVTDPVRRGLQNLAAVGLGYLTFATREPGLFRTCHAKGEGESSVFDVWTAEPFRKAIAVIDELAEIGYLPPQRRPMSEVAIWSAVHGLAMLFLDGPLGDASEEIRQAAIERTFEVTATGLGAPPLTGELREDLLRIIRS